MTNELFLIKNLMIDCAEMGAARYAKSIKPKSDELTQRQAYILFGEAYVKQCVQDGLIARKRKGVAKNSPVYYSRTEILAAKNAKNASRLGMFDGTKI